MNKLVTAALGALLLPVALSTPNDMIAQTRQNPFMVPYETPFGIPPFEQISYEDYMPAIEKGIADKRAEIEAIANNPATPTFDNTILAMEKSGDLLQRVMLVFGALDETDNNEQMLAISEKAYPMVSAASDEIMMNDKLFQRVKYLYDRRDQLGLDGPQKRALELAYKDFTRNGALLSPEKKEELKALNNELSLLFLTFNKNLLASTNSFEIVVDDPAQLAGIPAGIVATAAEEANKRGKSGKWVFTLHAPSRLPVLKYADNRDLREKMYQGYMNLASTAPYDNRPVIEKLVKARAKKAHLLGYDTFAAYMTDNVMAKTPDAARNLLLQIWGPTKDRVKEEVAEMQTYIDQSGEKFTLAPWDYYYYAEKVRQKKFDLDENEVSAYFSVDNVRKGIFTLAERLYGVTFTELPDAPKYNPEVKVYEVKDKDNNHVAVFMTDYFPRPSKRQGAWMSEFRSAYEDADGTSARPIVYNVGNFTRPTADTPALLTLDEVATMFHEFGHGLHGMLTKAKLRSQAGTNVDRDFVELPSQITEHWALEPELLKEYAFHYKTGQPIPESLVKKVQAASTHNQGFEMTERVTAALLDLEWGELNPTDSDKIDVDAFEEQVAAKLDKPSQIAYRYRSPYFKHIFGSDGYASGYYTYMWAEVLDTDGFELFSEKGIFDPATAKSFKENILEMGGSEDPMTLFKRFRGHEPKVDALLRAHGLTPRPEGAKGGDINTPGGK
ncbi:MAG: M3 family metallopeptidase [Duncaniella sp.]|uniref:M3 family metallopeptidase n=1 Tax=Duncaniella sp. TaxID=2518496 RepID=UPI0023D6A054|nr:M3 family metallopeptidase [Duncaniella sp.]MDE6091147.1 M3 family metallopeptidase [Duncaniella sp.]